MDLRPINPYYRQVQTARKYMLRMFASDGIYSYPYVWQQPVVDRSETDVICAKELLAKSWAEMTTEQREEYLSGLKGCMNQIDFQRIENNIQILADVLGVELNSYVDKVPEFITEEYFQQMKENVSVIREEYCVHSDTPRVPELPFNAWQKFNDIEKILADVYEVVNAQFHYYAGGEIYAGEESGLLL